MRRLWRWLPETHISSGLALRTPKYASMTPAAGALVCSDLVVLTCPAMELR